jgi:hypothetical protein
MYILIDLHMYGYTDGTKIICVEIGRHRPKEIFLTFLEVKIETHISEPFGGIFLQELKKTIFGDTIAKFSPNEQAVFKSSTF